MSDLRKLEYRVKHKTIYFVTRYCEVDGDGMVGTRVTEEGEFKDALSAQRTAVALCMNDHARSGIPDGDDRIVWPAPLEYDDPQPE